jgi:hypothetical protein
MHLVHFCKKKFQSAFGSLKMTCMLFNEMVSFDMRHCGSGIENGENPIYFYCRANVGTLFKPN